VANSMRSRGGAAGLNPSEADGLAGTAEKGVAVPWRSGARGRPVSWCQKPRRRRPRPSGAAGSAGGVKKEQSRSKASKDKEDTSVFFSSLVALARDPSHSGSARTCCAPPAGPACKPTACFCVDLQKRCAGPVPGLVSPPRSGPIRCTSPVAQHAAEAPEWQYIVLVVDRRTPFWP